MNGNNSNEQHSSKTFSPGHGQGKYVLRLTSLEEENEILKVKVDSLEKWKRAVGQWMLEEFGVSIDEDSFDRSQNSNSISNLNTTRSSVLSGLGQEYSNGNGGTPSTSPLRPWPTENGTNRNPAEISEPIIPIAPPSTSAQKRLPPQTSKTSTPKPTIAISRSDTPRSSPSPVSNDTVTPKSTPGIRSNLRNKNDSVEDTSTTTNDPVPGPSSGSRTKAESGSDTASLAEEIIEPVVPVPQPEDDTPCDVCRSPHPEENNTMIFCDGPGCNLCVHQACYGVLKVPSGHWLCRTCAKGIQPGTQECLFCPQKGGAMTPCKSPSGKQWAHVSCAWWIPEITFGNTSTIEPVINIPQIPKDRWRLMCALCSNRRGACIQCAKKACKVAFHVSCAYRRGLKMEITDGPNDDSFKMEPFCLAHSDMANIAGHFKKAKRRKIEKDTRRKE